MFAHKGFVSHIGRTAMIAGVAATVLTSVGPTAAVAAPAAKEKGLTTATGTSGATDFSARRRYYRGGGGAAAAAATFARPAWGQDRISKPALRRSFSCRTCPVLTKMASMSRPQRRKPTAARRRLTATPCGG